MRHKRYIKRLKGRERGGGGGEREERESEDVTLRESVPAEDKYWYYDVYVLAIAFNFNL